MNFKNALYLNSLASFNAVKNFWGMKYGNMFHPCTVTESMHRTTAAQIEYIRLYNSINDCDFEPYANKIHTFI